MMYSVRTIEVILIGILLLMSVASIVIKIVTGETKKNGIFKEVSVLLVSLLAFYLLFFAGEYSKLNINKDTVDRLLNLSVQKIDMSKFEKASGNALDNSNDDLIGDYVFELENSSVNGRICISKCEDTSIEHDYYSPVRKLLTKEYSSDNAYLLVDARESDRNFNQFPLIKSYISSVSLIKDGYLIEISYWELKNNSETVDMILDNMSVL